MPRTQGRPSRLTAAVAAVATTIAGTVAVVGLTAAPAQADNVVTPGNFTGYGFDQCVAPTQQAMDRWLNFSPFLAVGIYISGNSRGCRSQPNLTPAWVSKQLRSGWRLLPITLGPQAWCHPSFPRYSDDVDIDRDPGGGRYVNARRQGQREAVSAIAAARQLGIRRGSTLWYDLEGFDVSNTTCRESSLAFLSGWSWKLKRKGWAPGVYSSASSGIKMLDDARKNRPKQFVLPTYLWIARWDGRANTSTTYISDYGWNPHRRVKQYRGDHNETWGGVTINIDSNWLDVGRGSVAPWRKRCGGVRVDWHRYSPVSPGADNRRGQVRALQCMLTERKFYDGKLNSRYTKRTQAAVDRWRQKRGFATGGRFTKRQWVAMFASGRHRALKIGSAGEPVRRLQRALNAGGHRRGWANGVFDSGDRAAVRRWQGAVGYPRTGVMASWMWARMIRGRH